MGADEAAVAALDAQLRVPGCDQLGDVALLVRRRAAGVGAVDGQRADRQLVARPAIIAAVTVRTNSGASAGTIGSGSRVGRRPLGQLHAVQPVERAIDRRLVALHNLGAALAVGLGDRRLDPLDRLLGLEHARDREEARLQHRVDPPGKARVARDLPRIDHVQLDPLGENLLLDRTRERVPHAIGWLAAVEQQRRSRRGSVEHLVALQQAEVVAADEARLRDQVGRVDRL